MLKTMLASLAALALAASGFSGAQPANQVPVRVSRDIAPPAKIKHVDPDYSAAARAAGAFGTVIVEFVVDVTGRVQSAKVLRSVPALDEAALAAVRQWQFQPPMPGGVSRPVIILVSLTFKPPPQGTYSTAPRIGGKEFLQRAGSVGLRVELHGDSTKYTTPERAEAVLTRALATQGVKINPNAPIRAVASIRAKVVDYTRTTTWRDRAGRYSTEDKTPIAGNFVDLRFEVATPVIRNGKFANVRVSPALNWSAGIGFEPRDSTVFEDDLRRAFNDVLEAIAGSPARTAESLEPAKIPAIDEAYVTAYSTGSVVDSRVVNFGATASLRVDLLGEASKHHTVAALTDAWTKQLGALGIAVRPTAQWQVKYEVGVMFHNAVRLLNVAPFNAVARVDGLPYYGVFERVCLYESDVVYDLDGRLVRSDACLFSASSDALCEPAELNVTIRRMIEQRMQGIATLLAKRHQ